MTVHLVSNITLKGPYLFDGHVPYFTESWEVKEINVKVGDYAFKHGS